MARGILTRVERKEIREKVLSQYQAASIEAAQALVSYAMHETEKLIEKAYKDPKFEKIGGTDPD